MHGNIKDFVLCKGVDLCIRNYCYVGSLDIIVTQMLDAVDRMQEYFTDLSALEI